MDKIIMKNLAFFGYHGAMKEETVLGQKFFLDLELYVDLDKAGKSDQVEDTVHYGEVYQVVKEKVEKQRYDLIEALAENIAQAVLEGFEKIKEIKVRVRKPEAPVPAIFDYVAVEIVRAR